MKLLRQLEGCAPAAACERLASEKYLSSSRRTVILKNHFFASWSFSWLPGSFTSRNYSILIPQGLLACLVTNFKTKCLYLKLQCGAWVFELETSLSSQIRGPRFFSIFDNSGNNAASREAPTASAIAKITAQQPGPHMCSTSPVSGPTPSAPNSGSQMFMCRVQTLLARDRRYHQWCPVFGVIPASEPKSGSSFHISLSEQVCLLSNTRWLQN